MTSDDKPISAAASIPGQKATLHDVAERVGVSPRTVSRVVNDEGGFSSATRERVLNAINELGYRPNLLARSLITNRSNTVAFVVPVIDDPFFPEVAQGVQAAARDRGLTMFLAVTEGRLELQRQVLERMASHGIDGLILFPHAEDLDDVARFAGQGLPTVVIDDALDHPNVCVVRSDLEHGVSLAVDHLRERGRTSLAMLANEASPRRKLRRETTFRSMVPNGIVVKSPPTFEAGYRATAELLAREERFDGLFAFNDVMAAGAITAIIDSGRSVPGDISVVGCDDIEMSALLTPGLTTIRIDRERLGAEAVSRLIQLRDSVTAPPASTLTVSLVVRESS